MNEIITYDPYKNYKKGAADKVTEFMWWCAGADKQILKHSSYSDHIKFFCLGAVVLSTGVMAFISMGFAIHEIFHNVIATLSVGIIWSLMIFNIDRFIVSTTGKGDGTENISLKELVNASPRLVMAIILGLTISAPLETKLFEKEIEREWIDTKKELTQKAINESRARMQSSGSVIKAKNQFQLDSTRLFEKEKNFQEQKKITENIQKGICTAGKNCPTHGIFYINYELSKNERDSAQFQFELSKKNLIEKEQLEIKKLEDEAQEIKSMQSGFLDKIMMLEKLSSQNKEIPEYDPVTFKPLEDKPKKIVYGEASGPIWLVRILLMFIEIAPILFKLMLIKTPYDYISENNNEILERKQGVNIRPRIDENGKNITYIRDSQLALSVTKINQELLRAQEELFLVKIDKIKKEQIDIINNEKRP